MSKKDKIKYFIRHSNMNWTVNALHFHLIGEKNGVIWHTPIIVCSKSTIRNALQDMVKSGELTSWYRVGHCYDSLVYGNKLQ